MKLKALKPQTGSYGSIDANGVIEIDGPAEAQALLATGNWVEATQADLTAAKKRQEQFVADSTAMPVGPRFASVGGTLAEPIKPAAVQAAEVVAEQAEERATAVAAEAEKAAGHAARVKAIAEIDAEQQAKVDAKLAETAAATKAAAGGKAAPAGEKPAGKTQ